MSAFSVLIAENFTPEEFMSIMTEPLVAATRGDMVITLCADDLLTRADVRAENGPPTPADIVIETAERVGWMHCDGVCHDSTD